MKIEDVPDSIRRDIAGLRGAPRGTVAAAAVHTAAARRAELHAAPSPDQPAAAAAFANALAPLEIVYGRPGRGRT